MPPRANAKQCIWRFTLASKTVQSNIKYKSSDIYKKKRTKTSQIWVCASLGHHLTLICHVSKSEWCCLMSFLLLIFDSGAKKNVIWKKWVSLILENGGGREQYCFEATIKPKCSTLCFFASLNSLNSMPHNPEFNFTMSRKTRVFKLRNKVPMRQEEKPMPTRVPSAIRLSANCSTKMLVSRTTKFFG